MIISLDKINLKSHGVIHVGAHYGQEYEDYVRCGIENMIFFEPVSSNFKILSEKLSNYKNVILYNIAIGNETEERKMYIETVNNGQSCSLLEPLEHLNIYPNIIFDDFEIVKIDKIDNIDFDRGKYNVFNIDTQGTELDVLKGAKDTLEFIDIIFIEVNTKEIYKNCCMINDIDNFLKHYKFKRILTDYHGGNWGQGDALYLKIK